MSEGENLLSVSRLQGLVVGVNSEEARIFEGLR